MKAFLASVIATIAIVLAADYLLGGPFLNSGGVLIENNAAAVHTSSNVRLPDRD